MKKTILFVFVSTLLLLMLVACEESAPFIESIYLKTGNVAYAGVGEELKPTVVIKYNNGSTIEEVGFVDTSEHGFTDVICGDLVIEDGAYIYDEALDILPSEFGEEYDNKYILLKAVDGGYTISKNEADYGKASVTITAKNLYILGEEDVELKAKYDNNFNVVSIEGDGTASIDGLSFSIVDIKESEYCEVNFIVFKENSGARIKNCIFSGFKPLSFNEMIESEIFVDVGFDYKFEGSDTPIIIENCTFKNMCVLLSYSIENTVVKGNVFIESLAYLGNTNFVFEGNSFNNNKLAENILIKDGKTTNDDMDRISKANENCKVEIFSE